MKKCFMIVCVFSLLISLISTFAFAESNTVNDKSILPVPGNTTNLHSEKSAEIQFAQKDSHIKITKTGNLISVDILDADIEAVFEQISKEFQFEYTIFPEMQQKKITTSFDAIPLLKGMEKIVINNYMLELGSDDKIVKVYLLNRNDKDLETRNKQIEAFKNKKALSLDELKRLVTRNVKKEHPKAELFTVIPHEDIKGNLKSYVFSYYIGSEHMPSLNKVKSDINEAWKFTKEAQKRIAIAYESRDSSTMIEWIENKRQYTEKINSSSYLTLDLAATYDDPPIIKYYNGLPFDYLMYPKAMDLLEQKLLDTNKIRLVRTIFIDALSAGFEFKSDLNGATYWVDVSNNTVFDKWTENKANNQRKSDNDRIRRINSQWESFISR